MMTGQHTLGGFLETVSGYVCGDDLGEIAAGDTTEVIGCLLKGTARPYVRLKLCCSTTCESRLYAMKPPRPLTDTELQAMCSTCGDSGRTMQELSDGCLTEAYSSQHTHSGMLSTMLSDRRDGARPFGMIAADNARSVPPAPGTVRKLTRPCHPPQERANAAQARQDQIDRAVGASSATSTSSATASTSTPTTTTTTASLLEFML